MKHYFLRIVLGSACSIMVLAPSSVAAADTASDDEVSNSIGRFEITRFEVEGNTLIPAQKVQSLLAPFTGLNRDFGDVQRGLEALEAEYQARGFNVVQVGLPEQELNQGVVHFKVIETRIGKVIVDGNRFYDDANIRKSLPALREGVTPNIAHVSANLKMANESQAKKVSLQLQSGDNDDVIDARLKVDDSSPWKFATNMDNTGSPSTGTTRIGLVMQHANVAGLDHGLSLQYTTTLEKPSKVSVYGAGYHIPLYEKNASIDLIGSYSNVDSGSVSAGALNLLVSGKGSTYGIRYNHNFDRRGDYDSKLIVGLDYKAFINSVELQGQQLGNNVTVHPLSLNYVGTLTSPVGEAGFYIGWLRNIPGGDRGTAADFNLVRSGASDTYSIVRYGFNYSRALPQGWQIRGTVSGQYTSDSLVPGEQFGAGGASSVRGFTEREISNDKGRLANVELYTPNFCPKIGSANVQCKALAFYDNAYAARNNALSGEQEVASIGSVGLGMRFAIDQNFTLQMDYGQVVDAGGTQAKGDRRLHFQMGLSY